MNTITKITTCLMTILLGASTAYSQDSLAIIVDHQLIGVSPANGNQSTNSISLSGIPITDEAMRLTWCEPSNCYFACIFSSGLTPNIARITPDGTYTDLGNVTVPGETVFGVETIAYDDNSGMLYMSATLNGADALTETFLAVDTANLVGSIVGTFAHSGTNQEAECDGLTISDDGSTLYYYEVQGGGAAFTKIYSQPLDMSASPTEIYNMPNPTGLNGITILGNQLYFAQPRALHKLDLGNGNAYSMVATLFTSNDYNGDVVWGLSNKYGGEPVGINEISENNIQMYPNPNNGLFKIDTDLQIEQITVLSMEMKVVKTIEKNFKSIDLTDAASGQYIVQIQLEDGTVVSKTVSIL